MATRMKPIFGIDITENKGETRMNGEEFVVASVSEEQARRFDQSLANAAAVQKSAELPSPLRFIRTICGLAAIGIAAGIVKGLGKVSLSQGFRNAPGLFIGGGVCLIAWAALTFAAYGRMKRVMATDKAEASSRAARADKEAIKRELNVPASAMSVDVLAFHYTVTYGSILPKRVDASPTKFVNLDVSAFIRDDQLCLCDLESVYAFPLSDMIGIITVNQRVSVPYWNKETAPTKGEYKQYRMTVNAVGCVFSKPYHILVFEQNGVRYGIYFPCYELDVIENMTGLRAQ